MEIKILQMAACAEYSSPWAADIQKILHKTEQNLKRVQGISKNRTKSFFANSSEFTSTTFSLEKTGNYENEIENYMKNTQESLENDCEKVNKSIKELKSKLKKISNSYLSIDIYKRDTIMDLDHFERKLITKIEKNKSLKFVSKKEILALKDKMVKFELEKITELQELIKNKKRERSEFGGKNEIFYDLQGFAEKGKIDEFFWNFKEKNKQKLDVCLEELKDLYSNSIKTGLNELKFSFSNEEPGVFVFPLEDKLFFDPKESNLLKNSLKNQKNSLNSLKTQINKLKTLIPSSFYQEIANPEMISKPELEEIYKNISQEIESDKKKENLLNELSTKVSFLQKKQPKTAKFNNPQAFVKICINNMGESDDDSIGFTSPSTSPMNQLLVYGNSTKHTNKKFEFNGDTIHEDPLDEEDRKSPEV